MESEVQKGRNRHSLHIDHFVEAYKIVAKICKIKDEQIENVTNNLITKAAMGNNTISPADYSADVKI